MRPFGLSVQSIAGKMTQDVNPVRQVLPSAFWDLGWFSCESISLLLIWTCSPISVGLCWKRGGCLCSLFWFCFFFAVGGCVEDDMSAEIHWCRLISVGPPLLPLIPVGGKQKKNPKNAIFFTWEHYVVRDGGSPAFYAVILGCVIELTADHMYCHVLVVCSGVCADYVSR